MAERQTIVIAGAGIGGLTAALAIARTGFRVVICERSEELSEAGAGIQLSPNAGRVLAGLGLDDAIAAAAIEPRAIDVMSAQHGQVLASIAGSDFRGRYGFPYRVIHRADMQAALVRAVKASPDIRLMLGATIVGFLSQSGGLLARIRRSTGTDVTAASALIAADGVWSALREQIPGQKPPKLVGRTAWRAIVPVDNIGDLVPTDRVGLWLGRDAHLVHYPVARGSAVNIVAIVEETWDKKGWSAPGDARSLQARFAPWYGRARRIVATPFSWQKWAIATVDPAAPWVADRLAVLGDSAHAMVPFMAQGAAMALEDSVVLARSLAAKPDDAPAALRAYEAARKDRVTRAADTSRRTGERYHFTPPLATFRDLALRFAGRRLILGLNDWLYGWKEV